MAYHHIDSYKDLNYPELVKHILQRFGIYIPGAPPINHKPGNDWISDVYYPFPTYPDNRFRNPYDENLDIKFPPDPPEDDGKGEDRDDTYQIIPDELKNLNQLRNPIITFNVDDRYRFIDRAICDYTGLTVQAVEKRAFDITFVKPYWKDKKRHQKLEKREIVSGHYISIATFDGWKYHIYRGKVMTILETDPPKSIDGKRIRPRVSPFGDCCEETDLNKLKQEQVLEKNIHIVLDVSNPMDKRVVSISVNQIIDIEKFDFIYDFNIYEQGLKVFWDDWFTVPDKDKPGTWFTYVPADGELPQYLYHEVIEHQKVERRKHV